MQREREREAIKVNFNEEQSASIHFRREKENMKNTEN